MEEREQQDRELIARAQFIQRQLVEPTSGDNGEGPDDEER